MLKFFRSLRRDDRGDQLVGWVLLVSFVVLVGAGVWSAIGDNVGIIVDAVADTTNTAATATGTAGTAAPTR